MGSSVNYYVSEKQKRFTTICLEKPLLGEKHVDSMYNNSILQKKSILD